MSSASQKTVHEYDVKATQSLDTGVPSTYVDVAGDTTPDTKPEWGDMPDDGITDLYGEIYGPPAPTSAPWALTQRQMEFGKRGYSFIQEALRAGAEPTTNIPKYPFSSPGADLRTSPEYYDIPEIEVIPYTKLPYSAVDPGAGYTDWQRLAQSRGLDPTYKPAGLLPGIGEADFTDRRRPELKEAQPVLSPETLDEIQELSGKLSIPAGSNNVYVQDPVTGEWEFVTTDKPSTFLATQWIAANNDFFQSEHLAGHKLRNEMGGYDPSPGQDNPLWEVVGRQPEMIEGMTDFLNQTYELDLEIDEDGNLRGVVDWAELLKGDPYMISTLEELGYLEETEGRYGPGGYTGSGGGGRRTTGGSGSRASQSTQPRRAKLRDASWRI